MKKKSGILVALAVASATLLASCASNAEPTPAPETEPPALTEIVPITVGVLPSVDVASIYVGQSEGFFEEEGLDVTLELAQGGAAIVPAVVSGEYQFGFSNITSLLLGTDRGVPLRAVSSGPFVVDAERDTSALVVLGDSPVQTAADLEGRTVAVNALSNFTETVTRNAIDQDGGDSNAVNFVEVAIPEMGATLAAGQVDAIFVGGPGLTNALNQGGRIISHPAAETDPNLMISAYFTSQEYAASHPEVVAAFARAMDRANDFAQENPDATRAILSEYLRLDEAVQAEVVLPRFSSEFSEESFQIQADLALKYGLVSEAIDFGALLP